MRAAVSQAFDIVHALKQKIWIFSDFYCFCWVFVLEIGMQVLQIDFRRENDICMMHLVALKVAWMQCVGANVEALIFRWRAMSNCTVMFNFQLDLKRRMESFNVDTNYPHNDKSEQKNNMLLSCEYT